jgi:hypothetical protein
MIGQPLLPEDYASESPLSDDIISVCHGQVGIPKNNKDSLEPFALSVVGTERQGQYTFPDGTIPRDFPASFSGRNKLG